MHARTLQKILLGALAATTGTAACAGRLAPDSADAPLAADAPDATATTAATHPAAATTEVVAAADATVPIAPVVDAEAPLPDAGAPIVDADAPIVDAEAPTADAGIDASPLVTTLPFDCGDRDAALAALRMSLGVDSVTDRRDFLYLDPDAGPTWAVARTSGTECSGASSPSTCAAAVAATTASTFLYGQCGSCAPGGDYLVTTKGDAVGRIASVSELVLVTGAIDTAAEAWMVAVAGYYYPTCRDVDGGTGAWTAVRADGIALRTTQAIADCPVQTKDVLLLVHPDGSTEELETVVNPPGGGCIGRRPGGLLAARRVRRGTAIAKHFADAARLEAASVEAFRVLEAELAAHGAPRRLLRAADAAARDEVVHARMTARIARRHGAAVEPARVTAMPARGLEAIAIENAVEGCVRETYGALEGLHQARAAADPTVRRAMRRIAADEVRHAALAWRVAAWLDTKLSPAERRRVAAARAREVAALARRAGTEPDATLVAVAGIPTARQATALVEELAVSLWRV